MDDRATLQAFEGLAATYARHRPTYPAEAFRAMLDGLDPSPLVADVGCGTGISSRLLIGAGARVIGIEPNDDMRREALAGSPPVDVRCGTAEATGLPDGGVDAALAAQAFHWFDAGRALAEFHRIVRPDGRVALLWNIRVADGGFTSDYSDVVVGASERIDASARAGRQALDAPLRTSPLFRDVRVLEFGNDQRLDAEGVIGRATSASYFPRGNPERAERLEALLAAFRRHEVDGFVTLRHVARLTIATRAER